MTAQKSIRVNLLALFFAFGTVMAALAAFTLAFPGSVLEPMWRLNPEGHRLLSSQRVWGVPLMITVSVACAIAAVGVSRRSRWGYSMALGIIGVELLGNLANALLRHDPRSLPGIPIAALLLFWLRRRSVQQEFGSASRSDAKRTRF